MAGGKEGGKNHTPLGLPFRSEISFQAVGAMTSQITPRTWENILSEFWAARGSGSMGMFKDRECL